MARPPERESEHVVYSGEVGMSPPSNPMAKAYAYILNIKSMKNPYCASHKLKSEPYYRKVKKGFKDPLPTDVSAK